MNSYIIPKVTPLPFETVMAAIQKWLADHEEDGFGKGDIYGIYSPDEWKKQGEDYGNDASGTFIMQGLLFDLLNFDWVGEEADILYADFWDLLESHGYMHELGYSWSCHLYPSDS